MRIERIRVEDLSGWAYDTIVCIDPTSLDQLLAAFKVSADSRPIWWREVIRGLIDPVGKEKVFLWCGGAGTHGWVAAELGLNKYHGSETTIRYDEKADKWTVEFIHNRDLSPATQDFVEDSVADLFGITRKDRRLPEGGWTEVFETINRRKK